MKIGVYDQAATGWTSGGEYTRTQVATLGAVREELDFDLHVVASTAEARYTVAGHDFPVTAPPHIPASNWIMRQSERVQRKSGFGRPSYQRHWESWVAREQFDVLLSFSPPGPGFSPANVATCAWLPDFQYRLLPELFPESDQAWFEARFQRDSAFADVVILSSDDSKKDFLDFAPHMADKARVYKFASRFAYDTSLSRPAALRDTLEKYRIEDDFFLVVNQFWRHKNHEVVIEAANILKRRTGKIPQVVMVGAPTDFRDPFGTYLSRLLAMIAEYGLEGRIKMLGFVSAAERDALFRSCRALIQPSRFEGWNTSIEDAKAIGRPVIASGIAVNREQLPNGFGFFDVDDPDGLADLLTAAAELPEDTAEIESAALHNAREELVEIGRGLYATCLDAVVAATGRGAELPAQRRRDQAGSRRSLSGAGQDAPRR
jgi:glycosyltransferase involved in cell wall biosynthesis